MFPDLVIGTEFVLGDMTLVIDSVVVNVRGDVTEWHWDVRPKEKSWFEKTSFHDYEIREAIQKSH